MNNKTLIHPTAIIHPGAELDTSVKVGPYSIIGDKVKVGKDTWIGPHVVVSDRTTIGDSCKLFQFSSVGAPPQDLAYKGEETETILGNNNVIREFVTIHAGTAKDTGRTVCGSNILFMNYVHVAHDCNIGDGVILANAATLAGHVTVEEKAIVGGLVAVHQFVRIGAFCIIGGASAVSKDIPPYVMAVGNRAHVYGLNRIGLKRQNIPKEEIKEIKEAYNIIFRSHLSKQDAIKKLQSELTGSKHAQRFIEFIENATRGIAKERLKKDSETQED